MNSPTAKPQSHPSRAESRYPILPWLAVIATALATCALMIHLWPRKDAVALEVQLNTPIESTDPIQPIALVTNLDARKVALGRRLFYDPILSHGNQVSCASCHNLGMGGTDHKPVSVGINGAMGVINTQSVLNSSLNFRQFWDGRAPTLEAQIEDPIQSKIEMRSTWPEVVKKIGGTFDYSQAFRQIYGRQVQRADIEDSIAEFERSLTTPNCRFDRYLRHEPGAINATEKQGYKLFESFGCVSCHQGVNVGGNMYQKLGVMAPYFKDRGGVTVADRGRFNVTGNPDDMYMFKVPSLRNVELTAPYFHDAAAATLPAAVSVMAKYQLGRQLSAREIDLIVAFLKTLTGELDGKAL